MKKTIFILIITLVAIFPWQGCGSSKKVSRSKVFKDSTHVVNSTISVKNTNTDSNAFTTLNKFYQQQNDADLSVEKLSRTVESEPGNLSFVLKVEELKPDGDSLVTTDVSTGTKAIIYKDKKTGEIRFNVKQPGKRKETFEMKGLKLMKKDRVDSGLLQTSNAIKKSTTRDSSISNSDSTSLKSEVKNFNKSVKKRGGFLKWIGIIVLIAALLRLAIYLFRNYLPWIGFLNKILGGK